MLPILILVVGSVIVVGSRFAFVRLSRGRHDTISSHQRALAALREAEQRHPSTWVETAPASGLTDHVHILDAPPVNRGATRRRRRPPGRSGTGRRRSAAEIAARPTIAQLPTAGSVPIVWLTAPAAEPSLVDHAPDAVVTIEAEGA